MVVTLVAMVTNNLRQRPLLRVAYGYIIYESTRQPDVVFPFKQEPIH